MEFPTTAGFFADTWTVRISSYENYDDPTGFTYPEITYSGSAQFTSNNEQKEDLLDWVVIGAKAFVQAISDKTERPDVFLTPERLQITFAGKTSVGYYIDMTPEEVPEEPEEEDTPTP